MKRCFALLLLTACLGGTLPALADRDDHERARDALERGEVLPLTRILEIAEADTGGRAIEVEFERDDGRWVYELELITPDGRLVELEIDGATGAILDRDEEDDD
ncbi:PepSY domain-containing protein [Roseovarius indicus]|uniref:Peptidase n=1 Tax=Roseovarius indicus TaxID=540747 RepID=A0A0T5P3I0_9RHOB|nr:PepSY domain-containing protein [Roseovarius indicus]KRS15680.1 peptidase [Roseovarius indicus]OAO07477.1 peptidase [Roseovarius indicus]QEW27801.1 Peptidase propeptide and YPEB domain protein [Roseovarius indicus]SFE80825.1 Peptidase propeptide and YPEB domain-containing protein [Roseovarius indicus]